MLSVRLPVGISSQKCEVKIGVEMVNITAPGNYILRLWVGSKGFLECPLLRKVTNPIKLNRKISREESGIVLKPSSIEINLKKASPDVWPKITNENSTDKSLLTKKYQEMLELDELEINEKAKLAREKARKDKDKSVNSQITTEQSMRKQREDFKESEKVKKKSFFSFTTLYSEKLLSQFVRQNSRKIVKLWKK